MSKQTEAQRLADVLRAFDRSKQYQPSGPGGQMVGSEKYKLIAAGWTFAELHNAADELLRQEALIAELAGALDRLLCRDERNTCQHQSTHRGGLLWEICDDCNAMWADDEGGKPEWFDPTEWIEARAALAKVQQ